MANAFKSNKPNVAKILPQPLRRFNIDGPILRPPHEKRRTLANLRQSFFQRGNVRRHRHRITRGNFFQIGQIRRWRQTARDQFGRELSEEIAGIYKDKLNNPQKAYAAAFVLLVLVLFLNAAVDVIHRQSRKAGSWNS